MVIKYDYKKYNEEKFKKGFWNLNRSRYKWFSNYVKLKIFNKWANRVTNKKVFLDVGGGMGNWTFHFLDKFDKCIVLDISAEALGKIPERNIVKLNNSVLDIKLKDKSVDLILLADVFEHIYPKDLPKMMNELQRVLKDDGKIIIFTSEYGYGIDVLIAKLLKKMKGRLTPADIPCGHVNRLTFEEKKDLFWRSGFLIEDYYNYSIFFQQLTDFIKDISAKLISKFLHIMKNKGNARGGQEIKDIFKSPKEPNFFTKAIFFPISWISYLDLVLFGRWLRGSSIFLLLRKRTNKNQNNKL